MAPENISRNEYEAFMRLRETITTGIEEADSEFMLQTYKKLFAVINKRQAAANKLNISLQNREVNQTVKQKREQFKADKDA